jgi:hypothetical protein
MHERILEQAAMEAESEIKEAAWELRLVAAMQTAGSAECEMRAGFMAQAGNEAGSWAGGMEHAHLRKMGMPISGITAREAASSLR